MPSDISQSEIASLQLQLQSHEKMLDNAMQHDFEFSRAKAIYHEIKKLKNRLEEMGKEQNAGTS